MIKYRMISDEIPVAVPVLHRVNFSGYSFAEMREWLEANCRAPYYTSPGWTGNFVEFEDDQDATAFALRWR